MQRINCILNDPDFNTYLDKNARSELSRIYCVHDRTHALDVARIAYILNLEQRLGLDKETIYAAALLHDIGRWLEYENGEDHAKASARLAEPILHSCGFTAAEGRMITNAIKSHRLADGASSLVGLLYRADKLSRNCVRCAALGTCKRFLNGETPHFEY